MKKPTDTLDDFGLLKRAPSESRAPRSVPQDEVPDSVPLRGLQADLEARPATDLGGGIEDILGALSSGGMSNLQNSQVFRDALAGRLSRSAPITQRVMPTKKRRWPIAFGPTPIPPGQSVTLSSTPRCLFRGEKLLNSGDATGLFMQNLFIGNKSQLPANVNPLPVQRFNAPVLDNGLLMDTCDPGLGISMSIMNVAALTLTFSMTIFGSVVL